MSIKNYSLDLRLSFDAEKDVDARAAFNNLLHHLDKDLWKVMGDTLVFHLHTGHGLLGGLDIHGDAWSSSAVHFTKPKAAPVSAYYELEVLTQCRVVLPKTVALSDAKRILDGPYGVDDAVGKLGGKAGVKKTEVNRV